MYFIDYHWKRSSNQPLSWTIANACACVKFSNWTGQWYRRDSTRSHLVLFNRNRDHHARRVTGSSTKKIFISFALEKSQNLFLVIRYKPKSRMTISSRSTNWSEESWKLYIDYLKITSIEGNGAAFFESPNLRRPRMKRISTPGLLYMKSWK